MVNPLSFFKPTRPKLLQTGQTRYQSTPIYLYIHNIKLVCNSGTLCAGLEREIVVYTLPNINSMVNRLSFFKPARPNLIQIGQTRYQSTPLYLYIHNIKLVCNSGTLCAGLEWEIVVYTLPDINSMLNRLSFFKPSRPKLLQIGQTGYQSTPLYLYIHNIKLVCKSGTLCAGLEREIVVYTQPNINSMVNPLSFFKPTRPKLLQTGQTRYQSTPIYLYIHNIKLVCNSGTLCAGLEREIVVYTQPNINSMVNPLSFFKPTRPKLLQTGQTRYQSTPIYLYIHNIKLVCNSGTLCAGLEREIVVYTLPNINSMVNRLSFFKPMRPNLIQIGQTRYQSTPLYLYIHNIKLVCNSGTLCAGLEREIVVYTLPDINSMLNPLSFFKPSRPKLLQIGQTGYQSTPLYLYIHNIKLVCNSGTLCAGLEREIVVYTQPNINSMVNPLSFFKPTRPKLLQTGQTRYQSTPIYLYIHNIKLVCNSGTLCAALEREIVVYTQPNINSMVNPLSFFKPTRPKLLQTGQTRYQSTPIYLYIHNIKLVCKSGTLCAGLEREIVVYTQPNINSMVNPLSFFKPTRPKLLQTGQTRYQSTPIYLYIHNIKLVCNSGTLCAGLEREIVVYTQPNINSMLNRLSFFKPSRPNLLQIGQTGYQSTPLYLYIHNIKLVCNSGTLCAELEREIVVYTLLNINSMVNPLSFFKPTRPNLLQIGQTRYQSTPLYLYIHNIKLVCNSGTLCAELEREIVVYTLLNINSMLNRLSFFKPARPNLLQIGQIRYQSTPLYLYIHNIKLVCNSGTLCTGLEREIGYFTHVVVQQPFGAIPSSLGMFCTLDVALRWCLSHLCHFLVGWQAACKTSNTSYRTPLSLEPGGREITIVHIEA